MTKILRDSESVKKLAELFNVSDVTVNAALDFKTNSNLAISIRKVACDDLGCKVENPLEVAPYSPIQNDPLCQRKLTPFADLNCPRQNRYLSNCL